MREDGENTTNTRQKKKSIGVPTTPKAREDRIIAKAMDLAERKIEDGTASSQLICHFLKMNDPDERIKREILEGQRDLIKAKTENLKATRRAEETLGQVINAMRRYSGIPTDYDDYDGESEF